MVRVGGYATGSLANCVYKSGQYAYVAAEYGQLQILDVSNPTNIFLVGQTTGISRARAVQVKDAVAYVVDWNKSLWLFDLHNPAQPQVIAELPMRDVTSGVTLANDNIYVADGGAGLAILHTVPGLQISLHVKGTPGIPTSILATTNLSLGEWTTVLSTNPPTGDFDWVDSSARTGSKFYRARQ
jgi:hypothetical protein